MLLQIACRRWLSHQHHGIRRGYHQAVLFRAGVGGGGTTGCTDELEPNDSQSEAATLSKWAEELRDEIEDRIKGRALAVGGGQALVAGSLLTLDIALRWPGVPEVAPPPVTAPRRR